MFGSNPDEYELKTELASCCYGIGTVYLAKHRPTQQFVALKKIQMDRVKEESNAIRVSARAECIECIQLVTGIFLLWSTI